MRRNKPLTSPLLKYYFIDNTSFKLNLGCSVTDFKEDLGLILNRNPSLLNAQDDKGNTLLHYCFLHNYEEHLMELISQAQIRKIPLKLIANKQEHIPLHLSSHQVLLEHLIHHYQQYSDDDLASICEDNNIHNEICDLIYELERSSIEKSFKKTNPAIRYAKRKRFEVAKDFEAKQLADIDKIEERRLSRLKARQTPLESPSSSPEIPSEQQAAKSSNIIRATIL
tara:strand:+ start:1706 stop:2380 length:675 start_codon:yes stop_codon:yes gene_type:complete